MHGVDRRQHARQVGRATLKTARPGPAKPVRRSRTSSMPEGSSTRAVQVKPQAAATSSSRTPAAVWLSCMPVSP